MQQCQTPQQPRPHLHGDLESDRLILSDLLRRLNPRDTKKNLQSITTIVPDLTEDLLSSVDQPLEIRRCPQTNRDYLLCDYNRDGDSYRSPWSNEFDPPLEDGTVPSERVRKLEIAANDAFDVYRDLYYEGGVGSVYFWDLDDGFAGVILLKKGMYMPDLRRAKLRATAKTNTSLLQGLPPAPRAPANGTASTSSRLPTGLVCPTTNSPARSSSTSPARARLSVRWT